MKSIIHLDLDTFFVSCEGLIDSRLENRPVLIGGTSDRGVVASCSYEARRFGDRAIMRAKGMSAKSISRFNPFNGEPPPLLANRRV